MSSQESERVSHKHVAEIIEARMEEIFDMVEKELKKISRSGLLPAGIVLTGGGAKLPGVVETAKATFKLPCHIGYPLEIVTAIDKINDPTFTTAIGLVLWGSELSGKPGTVFKGGFSSAKAVTEKMNKWFKSLMP